MDRDAEAVPHGVRHGRRRARGRFGALLLDERQDFVGALVRALRAPRSGEQSWQPACCEGRLCGIEGLAADPERRRHLGHRPALDPMPTQHLVLHLHAIPAIEERLARERLVLDGVGAWMERAGGAECGDLRILRGGRTAPRHGVTYNTSINVMRVKEIMAYVVANTSEYHVLCRRYATPPPWAVDEIAMTDGTKFQ